MDIKSKICVVKQKFETSIYENELIWEEGEIVWIGGEDVIVGMVTICKFDKPFATYVAKDLVEEFFIGWQRIR